MDEVIEEGEPIEITNEFASVLVRRVQTRNGVRLRISSPKTATSIDLDALSLESLTWQNVDMFSRLLANPQRPTEP